MAQTSAAGQAPIPPAKKDDTEDVAWALSTAEAMYARGDRFDALKWLRRAAESASEAQDDDRALELAKAAADLATLVGPTPSMAPPPPPPPPPLASQAPPAAAAVAAPAPSPPPPPPPPLQVAAAVIPPAPTTQPMLPRASQPPPPVASAAGSSPSPVRPQAARPAGAPLAARGAVPAAASTPKPLTRMTPGVSPTSPRRAARRSRPEIDFSRRPEESTQTMQDMALPLQQPRRRGRASRPASEELTPLAPEVAPYSAPTPQAPPSSRMPMPAGARNEEEEMDAWPTQTRLPAEDADDLHDMPDEKTRIGVPAYEASARMASEAQSTPALGEDTPLRAAQAIRVIVWRTAEGVRVAPHGTHVNAITVDAMLVAFDPATESRGLAVGQVSQAGDGLLRGALFAFVARANEVTHAVEQHVGQGCLAHRG